MKYIVGDNMNQEIECFLESRRKEFNNKLDEFGDTSLSMNMRVINQYAGFISFVENIDLNNKSIFDIGCGLGHFINFLELNNIKNYEYLGVDIVERFIEMAREKFDSNYINFKCENFLEGKYEKKYDYVIGNQIFYRKVDGMDTLDYVKEVMSTAFELCNEGAMFNFLSDYCEIKYEENYYASPEKVLAFAYSLTKNIEIKNTYSPFEFSIILYKNQEIHIKPTYYKSFASKNMDLLQKIYPNILNEI